MNPQQWILRWRCAGCQRFGGVLILPDVYATTLAAIEDHGDRCPNTNVAIWNTSGGATRIEFRPPPEHLTRLSA